MLHVSDENMDHSGGDLNAEKAKPCQRKRPHVRFIGDFTETKKNLGSVIVPMRQQSSAMVTSSKHNSLYSRRSSGLRSNARSQNRLNKCSSFEIPRDWPASRPIDHSRNEAELRG